MKRCQYYLGFNLPSVMLANRTVNFEEKYKNNCTFGKYFYSTYTGVIMNYLCVTLCSLESVCISLSLSVFFISCLLSTSNGE